MSGRRRLVDGFNVMHRIPGFSDLIDADHEEARERFLRLIAPLALRSKERWTVVFDGPSGGRDRAPGPVDVVFARSADEWILRELGSARHPATVTVVTSDEKDIGRVARSLGASVQSADALAASIAKRARGAKQAPPPEKPQHASEADVDYWLRRFGETEEDPEGE